MCAGRAATTTLADTKAALAEGLVCPEQARAVADTVAGLPDKASVEQREQAEAYLLAKAKIFNAHDLRRLGKRIDAVIDPDGVADRDEGTKDPRTPTVRRADALLDLCRQALRFGDLPRQRGERPHVHLTINVGDLREGTGFGTTASGEDLTAAAVRRIGCDANLTAVAINADGVPLKVGRTERTVTHAQWIALVARDVGCVFPGCTRPAAWTQAHHLTHGADGGPTDLDNLALLCDVHHDCVHHRGWQIRMTSDGKPELIAPPWIDPLQQAQRNPHWHLKGDFTHRETDPDP